MKQISATSWGLIVEHAYLNSEPQFSKQWLLKPEHAQNYLTTDFIRRDLQQLQQISLK